MRRHKNGGAARQHDPPRKPIRWDKTTPGCVLLDRGGPALSIGRLVTNGTHPTPTIANGHPVGSGVAAAVRRLMRVAY